MASKIYTDEGYVITWQSVAQDGSADGIYAQRYDTDGNKVGSEFQVHTHTLSDQSYPSITTLSDGGFVISWHSFDPATGDGSVAGISGQRYDADGTAVGTEFQVNTYENNDQYHSAVTGLKDGGFVITWYTEDLSAGDTAATGISAQLFDANGDKVGTEFLINNETDHAQYNPEIAGLSDGGFVVTWETNDTDVGDNSGSAIAARIFDKDGNAKGGEFLVNTETNGDQLASSVVGLEDGGFIVTWYGFDQDTGDTSVTGISAQLYDENGAKVGGEFLVNSNIAFEQANPSVTALAGGGFVVTWETKENGSMLGEGSSSDSGSSGSASGALNNYDVDMGGVAGQIYDANGTKVGSEFLINTHTDDKQNGPEVTGLSDGGFVVTWHGDSSNTGDGNDYGISAQRFDASGNKVGTEVLVNTYITSGQWMPDIATLGFSPGQGFGVNYPPEANNVSVTTDEDTSAINIGFDATDPEGDALTYTIASSLPANKGTLTNNGDGTFTFNPGDDFKSLTEGSSDTVTFTYYATDAATNVSNTATVTLTITGIDHKPVVTDVAKTTDEDTPVTGTLTATDEDGGSHTFQLVNAPAEGSVVVNPDGTFSFNPGNDFKDLTDGDSRDVTFTYTATDEQGKVSDPATVTLTIEGIDHKPVVTNVAKTTDEDTPVTGTLTATDEDGGSHTFQLVNGPAEGSLTVNPDGSFSFNPGNDFKDLEDGESRDVTFTYTATDAEGLVSDPATVTLTITGIDHKPVVTNVAKTTDEDTPVTGTLTATDEDGGSHTFQLVNGPAEGSVTVNPDGSFNFNPGNDFKDLEDGESRDVTFTYTATDEQGLVSDPATVTLTIEGIDHKPVVTNVAKTTDEDTPVTGTLTATDEDGGSHTFQLVNGPAEGSLTVNPDGSFSFNPGNDFKDLENGESRDVTFTYTATDEQGLVSDPATVTLTIEGIDHKPVVTNVAKTTDEDTPVTGTLTATDEDGGSHTFQMVNGPAKGSVTVNPDGSFSFNPGNDFKSLEDGQSDTVTFTYTATDEQGLVSDPATVTLTIEGIDHKPVVTNIAKTTDEDTPVTGILTATDEDGGSHTFQLVNGPAEGSLTVNPDGSFSFNPGNDFKDLEDGESRDVTFTYTATDEQGLVSDPATVTLTIEGIDHKPVVTNVAKTTDEDTAITGTLTATDEDGGSHTFQMVNGPAKGSVTVNPDGSFSFNPGNDFKSLEDGQSDTVTFTYTATDEQGLVSDPATVTLTIEGIDHKPVVTNIAKTTDEDTPVTGILTATDEDGGSHTFQLVNGPAEGSLTVNPDGSFSFNPGNDFKDLEDGESRDVTFTYTATDEQGLVSDPATVTLTITGIDHKPVVTNVAKTTDEDTPVTGTLTATDEDGGSHTFQLVNGPAEGSLTVNPDGSFSFNPGNDFKDLEDGESRDVTFTYTATDEQGLVSDSATVTLTITGIDHKPVVTNVAKTTDEDTPVTGTLTATDEDGGSHTFQLVNGPAEGSLTVNPDGSFSFNPGNDFKDLEDGESRDVTFTYTATDEQGLVSDPATVTLTVEGIDHKPVVTNVAKTTDEDTPVTGTLTATDEDGGSHTFQLVNGPAEGSVTVNPDGSFSFNPGADFKDLVDGDSRDVTFTYTATDEQGLVSDPATVTLTVEGINHKPVVTNVAKTTDEDTAVTGTLTATDEDGGSHTFALVNGPAKGSVTVNPDGSFSFDPGTDFKSLKDGQSDVVTFTYTATDAEGLVSDPATVTLTVEGIDHKPVVTNVAKTTDEDTPITGTLTATDEDGGSHTFALVNGPALGSVTVNPDGTFSFDPGTDFKDLVEGASRNVTFTYTATDGDGLVSDPATVTLTVEGIDHKPVVTDVAVSGTEDDVAITGTLTATDEDGGTPTFALVDAPAEGSVIVNPDGSFSFAPGDDFKDLTDGDSRDVTFTYEATDAQGKVSDTATVTVTITGIDHAPVVTDMSLTTPEGQVVAGSLTATDEDGGNHTFTLITPPSKGSVTVNPDGTLSFAPGAAFNDLNTGESEDVTFTYKATDEQGLESNTGTVTVTVEGVGPRPNTPEDVTNKGSADDTVSGQLDPVTDNGFVIVWDSDSQDHSGSGIYGQRFDTDGNKVGEEFRVSSHALTDQENPSATALTSGGFVVTWSTPDTFSGDGSSDAIVGQVFDANGNKLGDEILINSGSGHGQDNAVVTALDGGGFVVTWQSLDADGDSSQTGIAGQRFDADGNKVGDEFLVNSNTDNAQYEPAVTGLTDGGFVVTWYGYNPATGDTHGWGVSGQRFDANGTKVGGEFLVNSNTLTSQESPSVTGLADGGYVVTWHGKDTTAGDDHGFGIAGQRYGADGVKIGGEFLVNTETDHHQVESEVTSLSNGGFVVTWYGKDTDTGDESGYGVSAQIFDADGNKVGGELLVNTNTDNQQVEPAVAALSDGGFIISWHGNSFNNGDADGNGVTAQRFAADGTKVGGEFLVNTYTHVDQHMSDIATLDYAPQFDQQINSNVTYELVDAPSHGSVVINADGSYTFKPGADFNDLDKGESRDVTFTYRVVDSNGIPSDPATVTLTIHGVDNTGTGSGTTLLSDDGYVVVWQSESQDGSGSGIYAQRYDSDDNAVGDEIQVNTNTVSDQSDPSVTGLNDGSYVITWSTYDRETGDGSSSGIAGQRFDANGNKVGDEFLVNTETDSNQDNAVVTALADGGFVVSWQTRDGDTGDNSGYGIAGQRFDENGDKVGGEFLVNTHTNDSQFSPAISGLSDGGFIVAWHGLTSALGDSSGYGIAAQRFDENGNKVGDEFLVNTFKASNQSDASVTGLSDGGFVVSWYSKDPSAGDGSAGGISFQRFDADGDKVGQEIMANTNEAHVQAGSDVTALADGGFIVTWYGKDPATGDTSGYGISGQRFDADGNAVGGEFLINTHSDNSQLEPAVSGLSDGGFVVTWQGDSQNDGDASGSGISGQRFDADGNKVGGEFQVNSHESANQHSSDVASLDYTPIFEQTEVKVTDSDSGEVERFDSGADFVLDAMGGNLTDIDTIDLSGTIANSIEVTETAVVDQTDADNTLYITGEMGDSVHFTDNGWAEIDALNSNPDGAEWFTNGSAVVIVDQALDVLSDYDVLDLTT